MKITEINKLSELESIGYSIENISNRVYRVKNSYGDVIASIFKNSGYIDVPSGKIFNYKIETQKGIKENKKTFFNIY